jgi:hypothetical protein
LNADDADKTDDPGLIKYFIIMRTNRDFLVILREVRQLADGVEESFFNNMTEILLPASWHQNDNNKTSLAMRKLL